MIETSHAESSTVSTAALQPLLFVLRQREIDPAPILDRCNIRLESVVNVRSRIALEQYRAVWNQALGATGDAALGVHVGLKSEPSAFGPVGYILTNAKDCGTALLLWNQFSKLILDIPLFALSKDGDIANITVARTTEASPDSIRPMTEFVVFSLLRVAVFLANIDPGPQSGLLGLQFRHHRPSADVVAEYESAAYTQNISFAAEANRILFKADYLQRPIAYADAQMLDLMVRRSDQMLRELAVETDLVARVKAVIRRRLGGTAPNVEQVAKDCNMSRASLQRKLAASGSGFQKLLDEVRLDFAEEYLRGPKPSLDELSFLLGYSDSSAFHHAFKRWTGMGPLAYRANSASFQSPENYHVN